MGSGGVPPPWPPGRLTQSVVCARLLWGALGSGACVLRLHVLLWLGLCCGPCVAAVHAAFVFRRAWMAAVRGGGLVLLARGVGCVSRSGD